MFEPRYTVQPEDLDNGLIGIAIKLYGSADYWIKLFEANYPVIGHNPDVLAPGQQLILPELKLTTGQRAFASIYIVQPADLNTGLPGIAEKQLQDATRWPVLYAVNRGTIGDDPRLLRAGQHLVILF